MSFHHSERVKRIKMAVELRAKGFSLSRLSEYFGVSVETVEGYLKDGAELNLVDGGVVISNKEEKTDLFSFADKTIAVDDFFDEKALSEGFQCGICKRYKKFDAGKKWSDNVYLCVDCFSNLTPDDLLTLEKLK